MTMNVLKKSRFQVLLGILITFFAILPFLGQLIFTDLVGTVILVVAVSAVIDRRNYLVVYALVAALTIAAIWYAHWFPSTSIVVIANLLDLLFLALVVGAILGHVFRSRRVTRETLAGAVSAYLLIGVMWADVFSVLQTVVPGSFSTSATDIALQPGIASPRNQVAQFAYFSFVTLSTLGYGDITPLTRPARGLAALEAIFGQLYLAILVARLVSLQVAPENKEEP